MWTSLKREGCVSTKTRTSRLKENIDFNAGLRNSASNMGLRNFASHASLSNTSSYFKHSSEQLCISHQTWV